jgi:putative spermidine/putrescine transport system ATP-binding protein
VAQQIAVTLRGVGKTYGGAVALQDFSLDVSRGELICLLGPSGCGKTTTLRIVAGFVTPTEGRVFIEGADVTEQLPHVRNIGMVFQNYALFPHLTVAENVEFGLRNIGIKTAERRKRVDEMLAAVQLADWARRLPRELSGGQQQRVALARALVLRPAVLLLDEPFSSLDAQLRFRVRDEVRSLVHQLNATTILVTHDQEEALAIADRIVVMNRGKIEQVGTPAAIYDLPKSRFVAEFIGRCNLLPCRYGGFGRSVTVANDEPLLVSNDPAGNGGVVAIRPEHLSIASPSSTNRMRVSVVQSTYLGARTHLHVDMHGVKLIVDLPSGQAKGLVAGEPLELAVPPQFARFLP